jgi:multicomponent K+:H+ antiporter subunit A
VGAACALGAALQGKFHRLAALIMVGGVGLVTSITFAWFSAPDLALTQIAVEVVTVVLFLLGLRWLPQRRQVEDPRRASLRARSRRTRDVALAVVAGVGLATLAFAVLSQPPSGELGTFFLANALEAAQGRNVVNVILVDFRGFDTLGEITVVCIVAITVYALLRRFRPAPESIEVPHAQRREEDLRIAAVLVRLLLPMAGVVSLYLLLRGHNAPGGGFVGGLVMATAIIVQYMVGGTIWIEARLRVHPLLWMGTGLLAAVAAGVTAWHASLPFLTARSLEFHLPLLGGVHLSSVLLFDAGVYMLVVGATLLMLAALAHQSLRSPRRFDPQPDADEDEDTAIPRGGQG